MVSPRHQPIGTHLLTAGSGEEPEALEGGSEVGDAGALAECAL